MKGFRNHLYRKTAMFSVLILLFTGLFGNARIFGLAGSKSVPSRVYAAGESYKVGNVYVGFIKSSGTITWADKTLKSIPKTIDGTKVKVLGEWCFSNNTKMTVANIPSSVTTIKKGAFYGCKNLKKVVFPKKVKMGDVEDNLIFWECNKLQTVVNNPDKNWKARIKTFNAALKYLNKQDPETFVTNVRDCKNQWIVVDGERVDYTDKAWNVVVKKANQITKGCKTDMEKAKKISKWIVNYLHYDDTWMEKYKEWRKTHDPDKEEFPLKKVTDAYGLLTWDKSEHDGETAATTCGGYGNLTQALFCAAGIPCVHIHREQKAGEDIDHVFNAAYINGKWIWIDNTYSESNLNYFNCKIPGFAASDHRVDRINLEYL